MKLRFYDKTTERFILMEEQTYLNLLSQYTGEVMIGIDASTSNTGIAYAFSNALVSLNSIPREKTDIGAVAYKVRFKSWIYKVLMALSNAESVEVLWEIPYIGYEQASEVLISLSTSVDELLVEHPEIKNCKLTKVNNQTWKSIVLYPNPVPKGTPAQKLAVRTALVTKLGACLGTFVNKGGVQVIETDITEDEFDALGIVYAGITVARSTGSLKEIKQHRTTRPFKYEIQIYDTQSETMEEAVDYVTQYSMEYIDVAKVPARKQRGGIEIIELKGTGKFDKAVYENMGEEDKVLFLIYRADKYSDTTYKYNMDLMRKRIGAAGYLVAIVWRKSDKR